ncbi:MAG: hypothetical protein ACI9TH_000749 [Kiritimatiellia bacterium]|jgi:hypothetical protein
MRILALIIAVLFLPCCASVSLSLLEVSQAMHADAELFPPQALWFFAGFSCWLILFAVMPMPIRTYVFGHELTHVVWAKLFKADVTGFKVGKKGGSVKVSKNNVFITLAPYFFPIYTSLVIVLYYVLYPFVNVKPFELWWYALIGFTWSFHITFTILVLCHHQPDLKVYGFFFSYVVIYLLNILGITLCIVIIGEPTLELFVTSLSDQFKFAYSQVWGIIPAMWSIVRGNGL